jgi:hypothetical protein
MPKWFNTAGPCRPDDHYMLPPERRLTGVDQLVDRKQYFVVHAPRQTGKTTAMKAFCDRLNAEGRYVALYVNVETAQVAGGDVERGMETILDSLHLSAEASLPAELHPPEPERDTGAGTALQRALTDWALRCPRPTVLFLDEIDALHDETLLSTLRQLRAGYLERPERFPQSIALVGLRDVRDYKARVRPESQSLGTASPFNIITRSLTLPNFTQEEVRELYLQHTTATGQAFTDDAVALAFRLTRGQPWLVNALAAEVTDAVAPDPAEAVTAEHLQTAKENVIQRRETHLDSLVDKLREERVRRVIQPILTGDVQPMDVYQDDLAYVRDLGLIDTTGVLKIANPIYAEVIPRVLSWEMQANINQETEWYVRADGSLDVPRLLREFQKFFRRHSEAWIARFTFQEAGPHLMLMAFLQRIVNDGGTIEREFAVGSGRADLVVRWQDDVHVIELKVRHDEQTEAEGVEQLSGYLDRLGVPEGYLVLFDRRQGVSWEEKVYERSIEQAGKTVHVFGA